MKQIDIIETFKKIRTSDFAIAKFIKKNGLVRLMKCTLNFDNIPNELKPKNTDVGRILDDLQIKGNVRVFDMEDNGWRTLPLKKVQWIEFPDPDKIENNEEGFSNIRFSIKK